MCARLSRSHSAFESTLNSCIVSYHIGPTVAAAAKARCYANHWLLTYQQPIMHCGDLWPSFRLFHWMTYLSLLLLSLTGLLCLSSPPCRLSTSRLLNELDCSSVVAVESPVDGVFWSLDCSPVVARSPWVLRTTVNCRCRRDALIYCLPMVVSCTTLILITVWTIDVKNVPEKIKNVKKRGQNKKRLKTLNKKR